MTGLDDKSIELRRGFGICNVFATVDALSFVIVVLLFAFIELLLL